MTYGTAQRRLRQALTEAIANGGAVDKSIFRHALKIRTYL